MSDEKISAVQNSDKSVSSKRVMYIWFSSALVFLGFVCSVIAIIFNVNQWWPFAAGGGLSALGVVHALVTGGYISAQDLKEIADKAKGE